MNQTAAAAELYKQSLDIRRDLAERLKTPNALRDLGDSLGVSGNLAQELGDYEVASELYKRELDIWRDLAERLNIPAALSAYSNSLSHMTAISVLTGDFTTAMTYCSAGQEIASRLPANLGESLIPEFERLYQEIKKRQAYDSH